MFFGVTYFNRETKEVVFETEDGKIRLTFEEWKRLVDAYHAWISEETMGAV